MENRLEAVVVAVGRVAVDSLVAEDILGVERSLVAVDSLAEAEHNLEVAGTPAAERILEEAVENIPAVEHILEAVDNPVVAGG